MICVEEGCSGKEDGNGGGLGNNDDKAVHEFNVLVGVQ